jgi:hypothetical protein
MGAMSPTHQRAGHQSLQLNVDTQLSLVGDCENLRYYRSWPTRFGCAGPGDPKENNIGGAKNQVGCVPEQPLRLQLRTPEILAAVCPLHKLSKPRYNNPRAYRLVVCRCGPLCPFVTSNTRGRQAKRRPSWRSVSSVSLAMQTTVVPFESFERYASPAGRIFLPDRRTVIGSQQRGPTNLDHHRRRDSRCRCRIPGVADHKRLTHVIHRWSSPDVVVFR